MKKKQTATGLIAAKLQSRITTAQLSAEQAKELKAILAYNDSAPREQRVGSRPVVEMLRELGWTGGRDALDTVCRRQFGRKGFATP